MAGPLYAGQYGPEGFETQNGRPARNTAVTVLNTDGSRAVLYRDREKQVQVQNPVYTDDYGNLTFFAVPGEYGIAINNYVMPAMVPIHPLDPALGTGEASPHPIVDWFNGEGDPAESGPIIGAGPGDMYSDVETGVLYQLR